MSTAVDINAAFQWKCHPKAEALINRVVEKACQENSLIATLSHDLQKHTSTRLLDWLDHVIVGYSDVVEKELIDSGFVAGIATPSYRVFYHPGAQLPRVIVHDHDQPVVGLAMIVDSIADFLMVRGISAWIDGSPYSGYRRCCVSTENQLSLWVVERRGHLNTEPMFNDEGYLEQYFTAREKRKSRPRDLLDQDAALARTILLAQEIVEMVGKDLAACIILECEREYWQARNTAGQIQKARQDRLGLGWANHDHHTFRSSRRHFMQLVRLFEILGFHCRERFYAGEDAGWGAQVMENSRSRLVLFLDVDLAPDEIEVDFAHHPLPERDQLGTIGLWCALHGDSILKAGMHHLEAQFLFEQLNHDLASHGISMMDPFSSFPHLKQAFSHGEIWPVEKERVEDLLSQKRITPDQAHKFISYGAVGSHMENLQRREGYKGFNQENVSIIIKKTDPRKIN